MITFVLLDAESWRALVDASSLLVILDASLLNSPIHIIGLSVHFKTIWYIWKQINRDTYQDKCRAIVAIIPLTKALHLMEIAFLVSKSWKKERKESTEEKTLTLGNTWPPRTLSGPTYHYINGNSNLFLFPTRNSIHMHWRTIDVIKALHPYATLDEENSLSLTKTLGKLGIT